MSTAAEGSATHGAEGGVGHSEEDRGGGSKGVGRHEEELTAKEGQGCE